MTITMLKANDLSHGSKISFSLHHRARKKRTATGTGLPVDWMAQAPGRIDSSGLFTAAEDIGAHRIAVVAQVSQGSFTELAMAQIAVILVWGMDVTGDGQFNSPKEWLWMPTATSTSPTQGTNASRSSLPLALQTPRTPTVPRPLCQELQQRAPFQQGAAAPAQ